VFYGKNYAFLSKKRYFLLYFVKISGMNQIDFLLTNVRKITWQTHWILKLSAN
jgi:hypothetical protein